MKTNKLFFPFILIVLFTISYNSIGQNTNKLAKYSTASGTFTPTPSKLIESGYYKLGFPDVNNSSANSPYFEIRKVSASQGALMRLNYDSISTPPASTNFINFFHKDASNLYGIYQNSNTIGNYFAGNVGVGTLPSTGIALKVQGDLHARGIVTTNTSSGGLSTLANMMRFTITTPTSSAIKMEIFDTYTKFYNKIVPDAFQLQAGAGLGKVLVSDNEGNGQWISLETIIKGDNLGNHIATQNLNISSFDIIGAKNITANNYYGQKVFTGQILGFSQGDDWGKLEIFGSSNSDAAKIEVGNGVDDNALKFITKRDGAIQFSISNTWVADITANNFVIGNPYTPETTVDLKVYGKIYGREVKVTLDKWYDHVFALDYKLMPLEELSVFVKQNNHLPDMPTESEVLKNGVNVGEMNALLLKKVEELTLYIIEQQKQNIEQQKQIDELKATLGK